MNNFNLNFGTKIRIIKFELVPAGIYNDQYYRPYESFIDPMLMREVESRINTPNGQVNLQNSSNILNGIAGSIVHPQAAPGSKIVIPNGWDTSRWAFKMEIEINSSTNHKAVHLVQGYSEYAESSYSGLPDPNVVFHINSVTQLRTIVRNTPYGVNEEVYVDSSDHVLINHSWDGVWQDVNQNRQLVNVRPQDIYTHLVVPEYAQNGDIYNIASTYSRQPMLSRRSNNLSTDYLGKIISSYQGAVNQPIDGSSDTIMQTAAGLVSENLLSRDKFIRALSNFITDTTTPTSFTLRDISRFDPSFNPSTDDRLVIYKEDNTQQLDYRNYSSDWGGSTLETQTAAVISSTLPSIMMKFGVSKVSIIATNQEFGGPKIVWADIQGFGGVDVTRFIPQINAAIQSEIFDFVSQQNQLSYYVEVSHTFTLDMQMSVSINGNPAIPFVNPTFADASFTPIISDQTDRLQSMAFDMNNLLNYTTEQASGFNSYQPTHTNFEI